MKNREQAASPPIHLNQKLTMQKAKYKVTMAKKPNANFGPVSCQQPVFVSMNF